MDSKKSDEKCSGFGDVKCNLCDRRFLTEGHLKMHMAKHRYPCSLCLATFKSEESLMVMDKYHISKLFIHYFVTEATGLCCKVGQCRCHNDGLVCNFK